MARRVVTLYTDDITGAEGKDVSTHSFSLDGVSYEIDLGNDSYQRLLDALGPYFGAGRKTGSTRRAGVRNPKAERGPSPARVRAWAAAQGIEVSARGRISGDVVAKYQAAH
ncbi:histone-like nucleoid-structuring protein Lsr2 [Embleya sp. NPDC001921]